MNAYDKIYLEDAAHNFGVMVDCAVNTIGCPAEQLSAKSGVPIRLIRAYEQGKINISNAEYNTIMKLRNALNCA